MRSRRLSVIAALVAVIAFSGCTAAAHPEIPRFAESGGQTQAELDRTLARIPGLVFTEAEGSAPNVKGKTGYGYRIVLDPDHEIADLPALIDFLVASAWSVRDGYMPNATIEIGLDAGPLPSDKVDVVKAAEVAGWVPVGSQSHRIGDDGGSSPEFDSGSTSVSVWLDIDTLSARRAASRGSTANRERLGEWPGPAVALPDGVVVPRKIVQ
jgi:hypothetical protein